MKEKESLEFLSEQAVRARDAHPLMIESDPAHVHRFVKGDGSIETIVSEPKPLFSTVETVHGLARAATELLPNPADATCHVSSKGITVTDTERRSSLFLPLPRTAEFAFFFERFESPVVQVDVLRRALLYFIRDTRNDARQFADHISNVSWKGGKEERQSATRGSESMDASLLAEAKVQGDMPNEMQVFDVRPYTNIDMPWRHPLTCVFDPDPARQGWVLIPTIDSWQSFQARTYESLTNAVKSEFEGIMEVVHGYPNIAKR